tara:strand:- start:182 stop:805 length:624 start_codon:yes stop_codon:yes gene_type:complete
MKRLLPIFGIFLITTLLGCSQNSQRERAKPLEEKDTLSLEDRKMILDLHENLTTNLYKKTDDFDNTTTLILNIYSKNKMLFESPFKLIDPYSSIRDENYKTSAKLKVSCKKYPSRYTEYELELEPSAPIINNGKVEIKWDDIQPQVQNLSDENLGSFSFNWNARDLIKRLDEHSTLKIRYATTKGTQIAEFALDENKDISELVKKCY